MSWSRRIVIFAATISGLLLPLPPAFAQTNQDNELPADFRGHITYQGSFTGQLFIPGRPPRRVNLRNIINSATSGRTRDYAGAITLDVEYDGDIVRGAYRGTGGLTRGGFTGTRRGANCSLTDNDDGGSLRAHCGRNRFSGTFTSPPHARQAYRTDFEAHAAQLARVDRQGRPMPVANDTAGGNIPRLSDHYSGRMTCDRGDISVRMSVFADGRGKLTVAPPSYGVDFDISLRENERGVIRLEPTSALNTTSYIARRYNVPLFSATMRQNDIGLYGETTVPGCGPLILVAHSSAIPLTPDQFNRLTERLTEEMLRPKP